MMLTSINPWETIEPHGERLIKTNNSKYEFYWGVESNGDYAFYIPIFSQKNLPQININIKYLEINVFESNSPNKFVWVIILKAKDQWSIFKKLCEDLCSVGEISHDEKSLIIQVQQRLKRWQDLLAKEIDNFPLIKQMGIFSELTFLTNIIAPKIGISRAVTSWVGIDYDKQDFLLDNSAIEIKSYRSSKGKIVQISSKEQLFSEKKHLYLATYALTQSENGDNIQNIVNEIEKQLKGISDFSTWDMFELKLLDYGYSSVLLQENNLVKFIIDVMNIYHVQEGFPRIIAPHIPSEIISLNYKINLSTCEKFIISAEDLKL